MKLKITFNIKGMEVSFSGYRWASSVEELEEEFKNDYFLAVYSADKGSLLSYQLDSVRCYSIVECRGEEGSARERGAADEQTCLEKSVADEFQDEKKSISTLSRVVYNGILGINNTPVSDNLVDILSGEALEDKPLVEGEKGTVIAVHEASDDLLIEWDDPDRPHWSVQRACVDICEEEAPMGGNNFEGTVLKREKSFDSSWFDPTGVPEALREHIDNIEDPSIEDLKNIQRLSQTLKIGDIISFTKSALPVLSKVNGSFDHIKELPAGTRFKIIDIEKRLNLIEIVNTADAGDLIPCMCVSENFVDDYGVKEE